MQVQVALRPCLRDQITVNGLFDTLLHEKRILLKSSFEDFALSDDVIENFVGRVGTVEELRVERVESLRPRLDNDVKIGVEVVLSRKNLRRDAGVFGNCNSIGDQGVGFVFECAKGVAVSFEEGDAFEGWLG